MTAGKDSPKIPGGQIDPSALTAQQAATILAAAGGREIPVEMVQAALDAGAPAGDGRLNLVELIAWLEKEMASR